MALNQLVEVLIAGGLLLLSFLHLTNVSGVNRRANLLFGIFAFQWSTFWLDEMVLPNIVQESGFVFLFLRSFQFLTPLFFFLSVQYYSTPSDRLTWKSMWLLAGPALFIPLLLSKKVLSENYFQTIYVVMFLGHALFYTILAYIKIKKHQRIVERIHSNLEDIDLRWIKYIIYSFIGSALLLVVYNLFTSGETLNVYINFMFLGVVYLVAFHSVRQKEIYPRGMELDREVNQNDDQTGELSNVRAKLVPDDQLIPLMEKLTALMHEQKLYLDSDLNLLKLADQMQISTHHLSYLINTGFNENFFTFINRHRVEKAKELLQDPSYDHLNILVIGHESGFNSKTSFNTTFKKMTHSTPTEYRRDR